MCQGFSRKTPQHRADSEHAVRHILRCCRKSQFLRIPLQLLRNPKIANDCAKIAVGNPLVCDDIALKMTILREISTECNAHLFICCKNIQRVSYKYWNTICFCLCPLSGKTYLQFIQKYAMIESRKFNRALKSCEHNFWGPQPVIRQRGFDPADGKPDRISGIGQLTNVPPKWQRRRTVPVTTTDRRSTLFFSRRRLRRILHI